MSCKVQPKQDANSTRRTSNVRTLNQTALPSIRWR